MLSKLIEKLETNLIMFFLEWFLSTADNGSVLNSIPVVDKIVPDHFLQPQPQPHATIQTLDWECQ